MGKYFDDIHESWKSQLACMPEEVANSEDVEVAKSAATDHDGFVALGNALTKQLKYRKAANAYSLALELSPDNVDTLRLRAGRYISTLQCELAISDLERCLTLGGDELDIRYRLGLCRYFMGQYEEAMDQLDLCMPLCDDEMGIAVIYWHTLSAYRCRCEATLLRHYHKNMAVGHHTAYEKAVGVCSGLGRAEELANTLDNEPEDMEYVIAAYGLGMFLKHSGEAEKGIRMLGDIISRDGFWPCYSYLAAWQDNQ